MSESRRVAIVRSLFERPDKQDLNGDYDIFTDDFLYQVDPVPPGLGYTQPGISKARLAEFRSAAFAKYHKDHVTIIDSVHEAGDQVTAKIRHGFSYQKVGPDQPKCRGEAIVIFRGDKVQLFKVIVAELD